MSGGTVAAMAVAAASSAYGSIRSSEAQSDAANFNAKVAQGNQTIALQNATAATQTGEAQAAQAEQKTRAMVGQIQAAQGESGVTTGTGSSANIIQSQTEVGQLDALTIRSRAAQTAYGYETQATGFQNQAALDSATAKNAIAAGDIAAVSDIAKSASAASGYLSAAGPAGGGIDTGMTAAAQNNTAAIEQSSFLSSGNVDSTYGINW